MAIAGIGQEYYRNQAAGNKSADSTNSTAEDFGNAIKYVQREGGNKVYLDQNALFSICDAQTGESANVYRAEDYSEDNPVYVVKGTDKNGKEYEETIDVSKLNPRHCSYTEMLALSIHTGHNSDRDFLSMGILKDKAKGIAYNEKADYLSMLYELMDDMKKIGSWDSYLRYDKLAGDVMKYSQNNYRDNILAGKEEKDDNVQESESDTEIVVRPDGSKVLMITTHIGKMETVTSVQISKPSPLQDGHSRQIQEIQKAGHTAIHTQSK